MCWHDSFIYYIYFYYLSCASSQHLYWYFPKLADFSIEIRKNFQIHRKRNRTKEMNEFVFGKLFQALLGKNFQALVFGNFFQAVLGKFFQILIHSFPSGFLLRWIWKFLKNHYISRHFLETSKIIYEKMAILA